MTENPESANKLDVEDSQKGFDYWISQPYISSSLRDSLSKANVLIIPLEGFLEKGPIFAEQTKRFFNFLKSKHDKDLVPDVCIEESDYVELTQHGRTLLIIGAFVFTSIIAPIFVNLMSDYIKERLDGEDKRIKIEMTVVDKNGKAKQFRYEGSANSFKNIVMPRLKSEDK